MLASPKSRAQQPRRPENLILQAKPDPRTRIQRSPPLRQLLPNTPQRHAPRRQKHQGHRRHLSVPDNILMTIASTPSSCIDPNLNLYQLKQMDNFGTGMIDLSSNAQDLQSSNDVNDFFMPQAERSSSTSTQDNSKFQPITPQSPFQSLAQIQDNDASKLIDELLFEATSMSIPSPVMSRRSSVAMVSSPLRANFGPEALEGISRTQTFPQAQKNSNPISSVPSISTFDLAPLPHPNFVNLAALSMPPESDIESYCSPPPEISSPKFSTIQEATEAEDQAFDSLFENMSAVPNDESSDDKPSTVIKIAKLAAGSSRSRPCAEVDINDTGISTEEISRYISGPDPVDGKWVCLFPECCKRFGRKENIKSHVQTHLGDRQFRCDVCKKCFVRQHDLKRHAKIHTGIKPYPCLCGNSFARHDALTRHRQRGVCIGAFPGVVKNIAKRGRPRKRPLEDGEEPKPKPSKSRKYKDSGSSSSGASSSSSDVSDPRTPTANFDLGSPVPDTPNFDNYESSSSVAGRSVKEESPELVPHSMDSPDYTPPTSPPEFYDFEDFMANQGISLDKRESNDSISLPEGFGSLRDIDFSDLGLPPPGDDKPGSVSSDNYSQSSSTVGGDEFLFSQDGAEMFELTALERDPSILNLGAEGIYIKPEMLSGS